MPRLRNIAIKRGLGLDYGLLRRWRGGGGVKMPQIDNVICERPLKMITAETLKLYFC